MKYFYEHHGDLLVAGTIFYYSPSYLIYCSKMSVFMTFTCNHIGKGAKAWKGVGCIPVGGWLVGGGGGGCYPKN